MYNEKPKTSQWRQIVVLILLLILGIWLWFNGQYVVDFVKVQTYQPSSQIASIAKRAELVDRGEFLFYASRPNLHGGDTFNNACKRKEAKSPILGCYDGEQIHLFNVTDERLDGIEEVTAAHEMLHAAYERLSQNEQKRISKLLNVAYEKHKTPELIDRMEYYKRTQPGQEANELHSILPTEFVDIGGELERYYDQYFDDRPSLVALHQKVEAQFNKLDSVAGNLVTKIDDLAASIDNQTNVYRRESSQLNADIQAFNERARRQGGFSSEAEFNQARAELEARSRALEQTRANIQANITNYNSLVRQLEAVNGEMASLYKSLDSTLSTVPTV